MNRKQAWLTVGCFLVLCGSIAFSIRGIKFTSDGRGFTAPHLNLAWLVIENAVIAIVYSALFLLFRRADVREKMGQAGREREGTGDFKRPRPY